MKIHIYHKDRYIDILFTRKKAHLPRNIHEWRIQCNTYENLHSICQYNRWNDILVDFKHNTSKLAYGLWISNQCTRNARIHLTHVRYCIWESNELGSQRTKVGKGKANYSYINNNHVSISRGFFISVKNKQTNCLFLQYNGQILASNDLQA